MTIQSLIDNHIRVKLDDDAEARWTDDELVNLVKEVVDQLDSVVQEFGLQFAKEKATLTTIASQDYIDISTLDPPFAGKISLTRDDTKRQLIHEVELDWEAIYSTGEACHYIIYDDKLYLKGTPGSVFTLTLWYWPNLDVSSYAVGTTLPWGGRLDFIIAQHVVLLCQNIDEMDIGMDDRFTKSLQHAVARKFRRMGPTKISGKGWIREATDWSKVVST